MLKQGFVAMLVGTILILSIGVFPVFKMKQYAVRKEIKRRIKNSIPEDELHILTFHSPETDVEWVREGKEFILGERMFDVVRKEIKGDSTVFHCVNDKEEAVLFAQLDDYVQKELQGNSKSSKRKRTSLKVQQIQLFFDDIQESKSLDFKEEKRKIAFYTFSLQKASLEIIPHPPQV